MALDLRAVPLSLHNVIVARQAFGTKAADPIGLGVGGTAEAPDAVRQEAAKDPVRCGEISSASDVEAKRNRRGHLQGENSANSELRPAEKPSTSQSFSQQ